MFKIFWSIFVQHLINMGWFKICCKGWYESGIDVTISSGLCQKKLKCHWYNLFRVILDKNCVFLLLGIGDQHVENACRVSCDFGARVNSALSWHTLGQRLVWDPVVKQVMNWSNVSIVCFLKIWWWFRKVGWSGMWNKVMCQEIASKVTLPSKSSKLGAYAVERAILWSRFVGIGVGQWFFGKFGVSL